MKRIHIRLFLPALLVFIFLNGAFLILKSRMENAGFDYPVLVFGNLITFAISFLSYWMGVKGLTTKNNHAFFRWVYGSFMVKLFLLAAVAFIYIMSAGKQVNKPALFFCMGLYVVYTAIEINALLKTGKIKFNA
jgi:hypothetical protein